MALTDPRFDGAPGEGRWRATDYTEAMAGRIERKTGVPIVSITYDGTGGNKNDAIVPYLKYPRAKAGKRMRQASNA